MSYSNTRTAEGASAPFLLVEFQMGDSWFFRYNDTELPKTLNNETWAPASFEPEFPGEEGRLDEKEMKMEVQGDLAPAQYLINQPPSYVCRVVVWEANLLDGDRQSRIRFAGRVISIKWTDKGTYEISVSPSSTELTLPGKPHMYQRSCPHVLYGSRCRATRNRIAVTANVGADQIIRTTGYPTGFIEAASFSRGEISWTNTDTSQTEYRTIRQAVDNGSGLDIYCTYPPSGVTSFQIAMGCTHTETACSGWHNNIQNFGGQPWIPLKSPHQRYTEFY